MITFKQTYYKKADIVLLAMPGIPPLRPSLGLSLLKSSLSETKHSVDILYTNIFFEKEIVKFGKLWLMSPSYTLINDWVFSNSLFPDFNKSDYHYLKHVVSYVLKNDKKPITEQNVKRLIDSYRTIKSKADAFLDAVAELIIQKNPQVVGCSSTFYQHVASLSILKKIKKKNPEIITIMGGTNCFSEMGLTTAKEFPFVDYVFLGEADVTFPKFINEVYSKTTEDEWELPPSIVNRDRAISIVNENKNVPHSQVSNLDILHLPDFSDYFRDRLNYNEIPLFKNNQKIVLQIEASRGCWWFEKIGCTFCGLNPGDRKYRSKSIKKVINEMSALYRLYKPSVFMYTDNVLNMNSFNEFTEFLKKAQPEYSLFFEIKSNISKKQVKMLADAKIMYVQAGIESLHDGFLRVMKKGVTAMKNIELLKYAQEFGVDVVWHILINFPGEKKQWYSEMTSYISLLTHLQPVNSLIRVTFQRHSEYFNNPEKYKLNLVPLGYYKYIYPFDKKKLSGLVYYFQDINQSVNKDISHIINLENALNSWKNEYNNDKVVLQMRIVNDEILITDTRKCAVNTHHVLKGNETIIYKNCDPSITKQNLYNKFKGVITKDEIDHILLQLISKKILLNIGTKYLMLAIPKIK